MPGVKWLSRIICGQMLMQMYLELAPFAQEAEVVVLERYGQPEVVLVDRRLEAPHRIRPLLLARESAGGVVLCGTCLIRRGPPVHGRLHPSEEGLGDRAPTALEEQRSHRVRTRKSASASSVLDLSLKISRPRLTQSAALFGRSTWEEAEEDSAVARTTRGDACSIALPIRWFIELAFTRHDRRGEWAPRGATAGVRNMACDLSGIYQRLASI